MQVKDKYRNKAIRENEKYLAIARKYFPQKDNARLLFVCNYVYDRLAKIANKLQVAEIGLDGWNKSLIFHTLQELQTTDFLQNYIPYTFDVFVIQTYHNQEMILRMLKEYRIKNVKYGLCMWSARFNLEDVKYAIFSHDVAWAKEISHETHIPKMKSYNVAYGLPYFDNVYPYVVRYAREHSDSSCEIAFRTLCKCAYYSSSVLLNVEKNKIEKSIMDRLKKYINVYPMHIHYIVDMPEIYDVLLMDIFLNLK